MDLLRNKNPVTSYYSNRENTNPLSRPMFCDERRKLQAQILRERFGFKHGGSKKNKKKRR